MPYTINSAQYANADKTAAVINTVEVADVAISTVDTPDEWMSLLQWEGAGNKIAAYVPPPSPVPSSISDRQFFQALAIHGFITQPEALAAVKTGEIPAVLQTAVSAFDSDNQFAAEMLLSGATSFQRHHPMTSALSQFLGWTEEQTDDLWRSAASL